MSINIFQFLKQGTSLNRNSLSRNQQLEDKIVPTHRNSNTTFLESGKFSPSDDEDWGATKGFKLDEEALREQHQEQENKSKALRKLFHIKTSGIDVPHLMNNFTKMNHKYHFNESLAKGMAMVGLTKPTPIQMQAIPALLENRNILVTAPTGTGKTFSYLIPLLQHSLQPKQTSSKTKPTKTKSNKKAPVQLQSIILVPFQELATQAKNQLASLHSWLTKEQQQQVTYQCISEFTPEQKKSIEEGKPLGIRILITTPMNFIYTFGKSTGHLASLKYFIMDECDKYFEESFVEQIRSILEMINSSHPVYGLFSATIQFPVEELLKSELLDDSIRIQVGGKNKVLAKVSQSIEYCTNQYGKLIQLKNMICENKFVPPVLIFLQEKTRAKQLYYELKKILKNTNGGMDISKRLELLTGDKSKEQRQKILTQFENGTFWVLITTDLVARGLDFLQVNLVINYDFPNSMLTYIHRVGRTGRADRVGTAVTFFTDEDKPMVRTLGNLLEASGCKVPEWIMHMPKADRKLKKKLQKYPTKRLPVGVSEVRDKNWQQELEFLEKKWKRIKQRQIEKAKKKQAEGQESGEWIQA